jgi:hypothetical protein
MDQTDLTRAGLALLGGFLLWGVKEFNDRGRRRDDEDRARLRAELDAHRADSLAFREACNDANEARRVTLHKHADLIGDLAVKISYLEASVKHLEKKP